MRIISQNGEVDLDYERNSLYIDTYMASLVTHRIGTKDFMIGVYNTKDDALLVMRYIRQAYLKDVKLYKMPSREEVANG